MKLWEYWVIMILIVIYGEINRYISNAWRLLDLIPFCLIVILLVKISREGANK